MKYTIYKIEPDIYKMMAEGDDFAQMVDFLFRYDQGKWPCFLANKRWRLLANFSAQRLFNETNNKTN